MANVNKTRPNIVSVHLTPNAKTELDGVCDQRGMTIKTLLGRLIGFFVGLDKTEQSIVLGQVESEDAKRLSELLIRRDGEIVLPESTPSESGAKRGRKATAKA